MQLKEMTPKTKSVVMEICQNIVEGLDELI